MGSIESSISSSVLSFVKTIANSPAAFSQCSRIAKPALRRWAMTTLVSMPPVKAAPAGFRPAPGKETVWLPRHHLAVVAAIDDMPERDVGALLHGRAPVLAELVVAGRVAREHAGGE